MGRFYRRSNRQRWSASNRIPRRGGALAMLVRAGRVDSAIPVFADDDSNLGANVGVGWRALKESTTASVAGSSEASITLGWSGLYLPATGVARRVDDLHEPAREVVRVRQGSLARLEPAGEDISLHRPSAAPSFERNVSQSLSRRPERSATDPTGMVPIRATTMFRPRKRPPRRFGACGGARAGVISPTSKRERKGMRFCGANDSPTAKDGIQYLNSSGDLIK